QPDVRLRLSDSSGRIAQRHSRRKIEGERDYRKLALVSDREWCITEFKVSERSQWYLRAAGRLHVDVLQGLRVLLEPRIDLEHNVILVQLREDRRHLPLAESVVKCVVDGLRKDPEPCGGVAIDDKFCA